MFVYPSISIDFFHNRELATSSTSSRAPTKDYLIKKAKGSPIKSMQLARQ